MRRIAYKRSSKTNREKSVLFGAIELFIKTNKPIGSFSLQEKGFGFISSATIRNYFNTLEKNGLFKKHHSSSGRIPTALAFREYANYAMSSMEIPKETEKKLLSFLKKDEKQILLFLQESIELLSDICQCPVFLLSPQFDQDFIREVKLIPITSTQLLAIIITDFGIVKTENIYIQKELTPKQIKEIETFFSWKLDLLLEKPIFSDESTSKFAQYLYNEIILRHIIGGSVLPQEIYKTGISKILSYPEFKETTPLANVLSFFEDTPSILAILKESIKVNKMTSWIGEELSIDDCTIIASPYYIHQTPAGAIATITPMRIPYKNYFGIVKLFTDLISETITRNIYKYKINFRSKKDLPSIEIK